jgi:hypothetical protein
MRANYPFSSSESKFVLRSGPSENIIAGPLGRGNIAMTKKRIATKLDSLLDRKLFAYATAAGVAGVAVLALAQPSQAEIVYTQAHLKLRNGAFVPLDLNGDGVADFKLRVLHYCDVTCGIGNFPTGTGDSVRSAFIVGAQSQNQIVFQVSASNLFASNLKPGARIGAGENFRAGREFDLFGCGYYRGEGGCNGGWQQQGERTASGYVGLEFSANSETYYGWARVSISQEKEVTTGLLEGYAYENIPGRQIRAGETSGTDQESAIEPAGGTLGFLALGAAKK